MFMKFWSVLLRLMNKKRLSECWKLLTAKLLVEENRKIALQELFRSALHQLMTGQVRLLSDSDLQGLLHA